MAIPAHFDNVKLSSKNRTVSTIGHYSKKANVQENNIKA